MCGRFTQYYNEGQVAEAYPDHIYPGRPASNFEPRYHICPTQQIDVIVPTTPDKWSLTRMRWGLVPSWWKKELKDLPATFNARSDTVTEKPSFRSAFKSRRCLIPTSGWYEWSGAPKHKQPWFFTPADKPVALIAALWETWKNPEDGKDLLSATMLITEPNKFVERYHDRMPVILTEDQAAEWMSLRQGLELLKPAPENALKVWAVDRKVNSSRAPDEPSLIAPIEAAAP